MKIDTILDIKPVIEDIEKGGIVLIPSTETYNSSAITYNSTTTLYNGDFTPNQDGKRIYLDSILDVKPKEGDITQL